MTSPTGSLVVRGKSWSVLVNKRSVLFTVVLALALFVSCAASVSFGNGTTTGWTAITALWIPDDYVAWQIVHVVRLPRFVAGCAAGAALAIAGCLIQTLARNRLATPDLMGVNDGATVAILFASLGTSAGMIGAWWAGPIGAVAAGAIVTLLAGSMGTSGYRIIVVGVGLSAAVDSLTQLMLSQQSLDAARGLFTWTLGNLNGRDYDVAVPVGIGLAVLLPLALLCARQLRLLHFGDDTVTTLGVSGTAVRLIALVLAVLLAGLGVGVGGPVGFVAMCSPIVASRLVGRTQVPIGTSALFGAILVTTADTLGRALDVIEIPAGVLTTILGGPFLLWVLLTRRV